MASSDNVVRAGLTPKFKDIETLLKILDFKSYTPEQVKIQPEKISLFTTRYNPPVPDFGVSKVVVSTYVADIYFKKLSIFLKLDNFVCYIN